MMQINQNVTNIALKNSFCKLIVNLLCIKPHSRHYVKFVIYYDILSCFVINLSI